MKRLDYFRLALREGAYLKPRWVKSVFARLKPGKEVVPYQVKYEDGVSFFDPKTNEWVEITDPKFDEFLVHKFEKIELGPEDLPNIKEKVTTTPGNAVFNAMVLVEGLNSKLPYITGKIKIKDIEKVILERLTNDTKNGDLSDPNKIYLSEYMHTANIIQTLDNFSQVFTPALSEEAITGHPDRRKVKEELKEKYKDRLNDPVVIATIDKAMEDLDRSWIKGTLSEGFYTSDKAFKLTRKRLYYMYGAEIPLDGSEIQLIDRALEEGWDMDKLHLMVNTLRQGIAGRSKDTALGGEAFKFYVRVFQNVNIVDKDCGSKLTLGFRVDPSNWEEYIGYYLLDGQGKPKVIDEAYAKSQIGKVINIRHPGYCKTKNGDVCNICMGDKASRFPKSVGEQTSDIGSQHLSTFMMLMHGTSLSVEEYSPIGRLF